MHKKQNNVKKATAPMVLRSNDYTAQQPLLNSQDHLSSQQFTQPQGVEQSVTDDGMILEKSHDGGTPLRNNDPSSQLAATFKMFGTEHTFNKGTDNNNFYVHTKHSEHNPYD